jgi:hypothetical protein
MRRSLAPLLCDEHDLAGRGAQRTSPVAKAEPSPATRRKAARSALKPPTATSRCTVSARYSRI